MAVPWIECSIQEQRYVTRFLWSEDMESNDIWETVFVQSGDYCERPITFIIRGSIRRETNGVAVGAHSGQQSQQVFGV
jgi:hypothetical protein